MKVKLFSYAGMFWDDKLHPGFRIRGTLYALTSSTPIGEYVAVPNKAIKSKHFKCKGEMSFITEAYNQKSKKFNNNSGGILTLPKFFSMFKNLVTDPSKVYFAGSFEDVKAFLQFTGSDAELKAILGLPKSLSDKGQRIEDPNHIYTQLVAWTKKVDSNPGSDLTKEPWVLGGNYLNSASSTPVVLKGFVPSCTEVIQNRLLELASEATDDAAAHLDLYKGLVEEATEATKIALPSLLAEAFGGNEESLGRLKEIFGGEFSFQKKEVVEDAAKDSAPEQPEEDGVTVDTDVELPVGEEEPEDEKPEEKTEDAPEKEEQTESLPATMQVPKDIFVAFKRVAMARQLSDAAQRELLAAYEKCTEALKATVAEQEQLLLQLMEPSEAAE